MSYQATEERCGSYLWLLYSSFSNHITSNKSLFSSLDSSIITNIELGDDFMIQSNEKGNIPIYLQRKIKRILFMSFSIYHI